MIKENCNFGDVVEALKKGYRAQRRGWNGKNMYIYLEDNIENCEPVICMFTAQGTHQPGWLASQPDMLAEDWQILDKN